MIHDNLFTGERARKKLMNGVRRAAEAVGVTMGTSGSNSLIEAIQSPGHFTTNDGATILGSIHFEDPLEEMGRMILYEAVSRANRASGDGSSTTCVLTAAILEEGIKHLKDASPMEIKRSLEDCIPIIEKSIKEQTKEITVKEVGQVATISAEDESIGKMVQEIYEKIGKDGIVSWDVSKTPEDSYTIGKGITVNGATYVSRYMCDLASSGLMTKVNLNNPLILLARKKIISATEVDSILGAINEEGIKEIVIFCEDIEVTLVNSFLALRQQSGFRVVVVKMPVLWADEWWEDLSFATGASVVGVNSGLKMNYLKREHLGTCEHLTIDPENTYLDGIKDLTQLVRREGGSKEMLYDHLAALKEEGTEQSLHRASRLNTKTARYYVGAQSESALKYRILKVEDAVNAAACALEHGVVPGGGKALRTAGYLLDDTSVGGAILAVSLRKPMEKIAENATMDLRGYDLDDDEAQGFDSKTKRIVDMFEAGIVDPADVVLNAVKNAIGVAASILTVGTVITLPREEQTFEGMIQGAVQKMMPTT